MNEEAPKEKKKGVWICCGCCALLCFFPFLQSLSSSNGPSKKFLIFTAGRLVNGSKSGSGSSILGSFFATDPFSLLSNIESVFSFFSIFSAFFRFLAAFSSSFTASKDPLNCDSREAWEKNQK
jgi:hypothetical protein